MDRGNFIFSLSSDMPVITVSSAGYSDTSVPRLHPKGAGFWFEYVLSGEECIESPELLKHAGVGSFIVIAPDEECGIYSNTANVSALHLHISGFVLEAASEVLGLPRVFCGSADLLDRFLRAGELYSGYTAGDGGCGRELCEFAFSLLLETASQMSADSAGKKPSAGSIKEYLDLCICADVDLDAVGERFGITGMHVIRLFRAENEETPMQYLRLKRLEKAASLLRDTDMSIKEISALLRFSSTQHFTNLFREHFGISPGKFRESSETR